jgi:hypothetical protein
MTKGDIHRIYRNMSAQDQRAFERWLKANVVVASVFAAGFIAMALAGADALGPGDAAAKSAVATNRQITVLPSAFELMSGLAPHQLSTIQVDEPF